ncbi:hypothetical protein C1H46_043623 [Malus baccata]|uniref:SAP domain-containing protein n=1 Tax=Malus baccata TaxID=106549 RepID=A0A540K9C8_MALBA|nr:hypothetical protein C1H46_043623 [Malus baccata]
MEASSSQPPSGTNQTANGPSMLLQNLPSRGLFSSTVLSSNPNFFRAECEFMYVPMTPHPQFIPLLTLQLDLVYPDGQLIQTNQQNILIRSLTLKKQKGDSSSKDAKSAGAAESSKKRPAERVLDSKASAKKATSQTSSRQEGSSSQASSSRDFQGLTVERLRALLKAKGLSTKGKKDELIARLRSSSG